MKKFISLILVFTFTMCLPNVASADVSKVKDKTCAYEVSKVSKTEVAKVTNYSFEALNRQVGNVSITAEKQNFGISYQPLFVEKNFIYNWPAKATVRYSSKSSNFYRLHLTKNIYLKNCSIRQCTGETVSAV
jgi:hypothetical protein